MSNLKDNIDVCYSASEIEDKISKKPLPNTVYDLGFIFVHSRNIISKDHIRMGYYVVNVDHQHSNI